MGEGAGGLGALHPTLALELETSDFVPRLQRIFAPRGNMSNWVSDLSEVVCGTKGGQTEKHASRDAVTSIGRAVGSGPGRGGAMYPHT
jgi:hypothetical protein